MDLLSLTTVQTNILTIMSHIDKANLSISSGIQTLANAFNFLWSLPDDELQAVLQELLNTGQLEQLFDHYDFASESLNAVQDNTGYVGIRAPTDAPRSFTVDEFGVLTLDPIIP